MFSRWKQARVKRKLEKAFKKLDKTTAALMVKNQKMMKEVIKNEKMD